MELLDAVDVLRGLNATGTRTVPADTPTGFVPTRGRGYLDDTIAADATAVDRRHSWELCLRDALRSGDVHAPRIAPLRRPDRLPDPAQAWPAQR